MKVGYGKPTSSFSLLYFEGLIPSTFFSLPSLSQAHHSQSGPQARPFKWKKKRGLEEKYFFLDRL
jgi:hypothetical protein